MKRAEPDAPPADATHKPSPTRAPLALFALPVVARSRGSDPPGQRRRLDDAADERKVPYEVLELCSFSTDVNGKIWPGSDRLAMLAPPKIPFSLGTQWATYVPKDLNKHSPLEPVITALQDVSSDPFAQGPCYVTWRHNLSKIMTTVYSRDDSWVIPIERKGDVIFLQVFLSSRPYPNQQKFEYWGSRFEELMTRRRAKSEQKLPAAASTEKNKEKEPLDNSDVVEASEYSSIMRANLGGLKIFFGAEVDCHNAKEGEEKRRKYVELKTSRVMDRPHQERTFYESKLFKYWVQSYLAAVPSVVVGLRDDEGVVQELRTLQTDHLPHMANNAWHPHIALGFLHHVLSSLPQVIKESVKYELRYEAKADAVRLFVIE